MKNNVSLSDSGWNLQSSYTQISDKLFSELKPDAVTNPSIVIVNNELAEKLGLNLKVSLKKTYQIYSQEINCPMAQSHLHKLMLDINLDNSQFLVTVELTLSVNK